MPPSVHNFNIFLVRNIMIVRVFDILINVRCLTLSDYFSVCCVCKDMNDIVSRSNVVNDLMYKEAARRGLAIALSPQEMSKRWKHVISSARGFSRRSIAEMTKMPQQSENAVIVSTHMSTCQSKLLIIKKHSSRRTRLETGVVFDAEVLDTLTGDVKAVQGGHVLVTSYGKKWISDKVLVALTSADDLAIVFNFYTFELAEGAYHLTVSSSINLNPLIHPRHVYSMSPLDSIETLPTNFVASTSNGHLLTIDLVGKHIAMEADKVDYVNACSFGAGFGAGFYAVAQCKNSKSYLTLRDPRCTWDSCLQFHIPHQFIRRVKMDEAKAERNSVYISCGRSSTVDEYDLRYLAEPLQSHRHFGESSSSSSSRVLDFSVYGARLALAQCSGRTNLKTFMTGFVRGLERDVFLPSSCTAVPWEGHQRGQKKVWGGKDLVFPGELSGMLFDDDRTDMEVESRIHFAGKDLFVHASGREMHSIQIHY